MRAARLLAASASVATSFVLSLWVWPASADPLQEAGVAYSKGDYAQVHSLLSPLAEKGDFRALTALGVMHEFGQGVARNFEKAAILYRAAADQGFAPAKANLGYLYLTGRGVPEDLAAARTLFESAATHGESYAQNQLGEMYLAGKGVQQDSAMAVAWFLKSARQGNPSGQISLGESYALGRGVGRDNVQAYKWLALAATQGNDTARKRLLNVAGNMSSAEQEEAKRLVTEWKPEKRSLSLPVLPAKGTAQH